MVSMVETCKFLLRCIKSCETAEQLDTCERLFAERVLEHPVLKQWADNHNAIQHNFVSELQGAMQVKAVELAIFGRRSDYSYINSENN